MRGFTSRAARAGPGVRVPAVLSGRSVPLFATVLFWATVSVVALYSAGSPERLPYRIVYQLVAGVGLAMVVSGAWRDRRALGRVGAFVVAAVSLQFVGDIGGSVRILSGDDRTWPSWTDPIFLTSYVGLIVAVTLVIRRRERMWDAAALIDAAIVTTGFGVVAFAFLITDAAIESTVSVAGRVIGVAYIIMDVLLVGVVTRLLVTSAASRGAALLLACAMGALLLGDLMFAGSTLNGTHSGFVLWIDAAYLTFFPLFGAAMRHRMVSDLLSVGGQQMDRLGPVRLASLAAGALLAPVTLLAEDLAGRRPHVLEVAVGAMVLFLLVIYRMSRLVRAVETKSQLLEVLSRTDALTGLANRRTFDYELDRTVTAARADFLLTPVSLVMIDLDRFKAYNDVHGHGAGDRLLSGAGRLWATELRQLAPAATLARYGGEEFAIVLPGVAELPAVRVVERLQELTPDAQSFSAGIAQWDGSERPGEVLTRADQRLYEAKAAGRATIVAGPPPGPATAVTRPPRATGRETEVTGPARDAQPAPDREGATQHG